MIKKINFKKIEKMTLVKFRPIEKEIFNHFNKTLRNNHVSFQSSRIINPVVNVRERYKEFELDLVAAGLDKDDFSLKLNENTLTISYKQNEDQNDNKEKYIRREFIHHSFKRSFTLPETVNKDEIVGKYEAGILTVTLPKKEVELTKEIKIS